jgi:hypothetical protein
MNKIPRPDPSPDPDQLAPEASQSKTSHYQTQGHVPVAARVSVALPRSRMGSPGMIHELKIYELEPKGLGVAQNAR